MRALVPEDEELILLQATASSIPSGLVLTSELPAVQMLANGFEACAVPFPIEPLVDADVPEMRALADLTKPGPFHSHTHQLGQFW